MSPRETFKRFTGRKARRKELAAKFNDDGVAFAQAGRMEEAYRTLWQDWCAKQGA